MAGFSLSITPSRGLGRRPSQTSWNGWLISMKKQVLFRCSGPVDGPYDTGLSTRCELCGVALTLLMIVSLSRFWGLKHRCRFLWYCDSKAAIQQIALHDSVFCFMPSDADLVSMISSLRQELRCGFQSVWVKGHQDASTPYINLSLPARLNIASDLLATRYRLHGRLKSSGRVPHEPNQ